MVPLDGHEEGGLLSSTTAGGSAGMLIYCFILSTEMIEFDKVQYHLVRNT